MRRAVAQSTGDGMTHKRGNIAHSQPFNSWLDKRFPSYPLLSGQTLVLMTRTIVPHRAWARCTPLEHQGFPELVPSSVS